MVIKFTIPYPKAGKEKAKFNKQFTLNAIYSGKHWCKRKEDKDYWNWLVLSELRRQNIPQTMAEKPVELVFLWDDGLDCSNHAYMAKMIEDTLVGYVLPDDNRKWVKKITHEFNSDGVIIVEVLEWEK